MSQQIALRDKWAQARPFWPGKAVAATRAPEAVSSTDASEIVEGLVDFDALHREVARMKAARAQETVDRETAL